MGETSLTESNKIQLYFHPQVIVFQPFIFVLSFIAYKFFDKEFFPALKKLYFLPYIHFQNFGLL